MKVKKRHIRPGVVPKRAPAEVQAEVMAALTPRPAANGQWSVIGDDVSMGPGTAIWNLVYVGNRVTLGARVVVGSLTHLSDDCVIGDGTQISGSVYLSPNTRIGSNCFIGPGVVFTNDPFPPVRRATGVAAWEGVTVEDGAIIGAGARLKAGITVGRCAVVGMGALVLTDVPPEVVVVGSPARPVYTRAEYNRKQAEWAAGFHHTMDV